MSTGRRSWASDVQQDFLGAFLPQLDEAKKKRTLASEYARITKLFLEKWPAEPMPEEIAEAPDPQTLQKVAEARRTEVSCVRLQTWPSHSDNVRQQITQWFKNRRKSSYKGNEPKRTLLDLSGDGTRKPGRYQLQQAYSIRYHRPAGTPLRDEVDDLWERRDQQDVIELLAPFGGRESDNRIRFHNVVMKWKVSLLSEEEVKDLEDWNSQQVLRRQEEALKPWLLGDHDDDLYAENAYIQE